MKEQPDNFETMEELPELNESEEPKIRRNTLSNKNISKSNTPLKRNLPHLRLMTNLGFCKIPAVLFDSKLNILWENNSYRKLFVQSDRDLPVNLVSDFSPFLTPPMLGNIYKTIIDKNSGFSFRGRVESKHRNRLSIIANLIITPYFTKKEENSVVSPPPLYIGLFDNISKENKELLEGTFLTLLEASKLKDNDTGNHIKRVGTYSRSISEKLFDNQKYTEVNTDFIENIYFLAPMHDVGKIGTPDNILTKPGPLTKEEWIIMKEHPKSGALILSAYPDPMAAHIANFHHEKWDGKGYPYGFSEQLIPLAARIVAIADVYDALRMKRSYKDPFSHSKTMEIIREDAGSHFDPDLIDIFLKYNKEFDSIFENLRDS